MGGLGENSSGDLFLAFATGNRALERGDEDTSLSMRANERLTPLFEAVVDATEEAILNALLAAETMTGRAGHTACALDHELLLEALRPTGT
jgi:L-aminopeptidase/D-esterase-like protein